MLKGGVFAALILGGIGWRVRHSQWKDYGARVSKSQFSAEQSLIIPHHEDVADQSRRLMERFNNRLTLDNLRLSERYFNGELHIVMYLRYGEDVEYCASFQRETRSTGLQEHEGIVGFGDILHDSQELMPDSGDLSGRHAMEPVLCSDSEQQVVLIDNVQLMDVPECLSCASRVRLDFRKRFHRIRRKTLFYSPNTGFEFLGALSNREIDMIKRTRGVGSDTDQTIGKMIQCAPEVVNSIAYDERYIGIHGLDTSQAIHAVRSIRCVLRQDGIRILPESFPELLKVEDVVVGPF